MTARSRARRAVVLAGLAVASGGLAASEVAGRTREVESQVGPLVPVVSASQDIPAGARIAARRTRGRVEVRQVPARFAPPDALAAPAEAGALRTAVPIARGGYVTAGHLDAGDEGEGGSPLRPGERAVEVAAAGGGSTLIGAGARVDVLVTTEPRSGPGRTFLALEDVEVLDARPGEAAGGSEEAGAADAGGSSAGTVATLRVTVRQAVFLTAAQSFAREVRLLGRAPGDERRRGGVSIGAEGLGS